MKICVYAICKNEEKFVDRWYESVKEADGIFVLDTGSTDKTVKRLKKKNIIVKQKKINPWRFDVARNESLKMIPDDYDICVCLDLDEIISNNWINELKKIWKDNTTRCQYIYNWRLDENNNPIVSFYSDKIHLKKNYQWINPVHEILYSDNEEYIKTDKITINHYPDNTKSRSSYLPLLELSVKENPNNDRNMHYLGREYMYYGMWNESIDTLIKHLKLKNAVWKDERCASMRFISRCYINLNRYDEAFMWLTKAIDEAPYLRDPYIEMALLNYQLEDYDKIDYYCHKALEIITNERTYINEVFSFDETVYDLLSISSFHKKNFNEALKFIDEALKINPHNKRIIENKNIILDLKKELQL